MQLQVSEEGGKQKEFIQDQVSREDDCESICLEEILQGPRIVVCAGHSELRRTEH